MSAQVYGSYGGVVSRIYFSILENSWLTFIALLYCGTKMKAPGMAQFNPLQTAVLIIRPLFVATMLESESSLYDLQEP